MAVESVTYINNLDPSLPSGGDSIAEGDDHIRNVKKGIKTTFPNVTGAVTATQAQLNDTSKIPDLQDHITDIEAQLAGYNRDELGGAKYNSDNGSEWTSGIVGSITPQGGSRCRINFSPAMLDTQYVITITPSAVGGKPLIAYVTNQQSSYVDIDFREFDGSTIQQASTFGFTALIMDAHDA
jgi:hypothetical protein